MDSDGGFHEVEKDGKLIQFVYHHPKYNPIAQTQTPTSSDEIANHNHPKYHPVPPTQSLTLTGETDSHDPPPQPLFLCPLIRLRRHPQLRCSMCFLLSVSPDYTYSELDKPLFHYDQVHHVLPLFGGNNKEVDRCHICWGLDFGTGYYKCVSCVKQVDKFYHKECVESPLKIKHPYHHDHSLQLYYIDESSSFSLGCLCCGKGVKYLVYYCNICLVVMHVVCAMKPITFVIDPPKRHNHPLTFFPRQASLVCNVCGLLRKNCPTYVCLRSNFVAHNDCMHSSSVIKISRHHHRVSYVSSLKPGEWRCGVCRHQMDGSYGAYICDKCGDYAVHSRCALRKDICDGEELEGVPEDDITQDAAPFVEISEGVILHFLHDHHLRLKAYMSYDEDKFCRACVMPIFEGNFYTCMECDFIIHETCAEARRRIDHPLHPHLLTLKLDAERSHAHGFFTCNACYRICDAFVYQCLIKECGFELDVRCASISEPFRYKGHEHPLFLSLDPEEKPICDVCRLRCKKQLNCTECSFIVCFKCATLPYKTRYKHDKHFLTLLWGEEVCEKDWCEVCERSLGDTRTKLFYWCKDCCTTLHVECLFGKDPNLKPGRVTYIGNYLVQNLRKSNVSGSFCESCKNPCQRQLFKIYDHIMCSWKCAYNFNPYNFNKRASSVYRSV